MRISDRSSDMCSSDLLEPFQVAHDLVVVDVDGGADLLGDAGRLPVDLDHHPGLVLAEPVEGDDTSVLGLAADARPGNALIGVLLGDLGVELALDPGNVGDPVVALLAHLADRSEEHTSELQSLM